MTYQLIPARPGQWINPDGTPTREFYRFIVNLFNAAGGGKLSISDVEGLAYSVSTREQDTPRVAAEAKLLSSLAPFPVGRVAELEHRVQALEPHLSVKPSRATDLETRVRQLELLLESQPPRSNLSELERRVQLLETVQASASRLAEVERRLALYDAGSYMFLGHH